MCHVSVCIGRAADIQARARASVAFRYTILREGREAGQEAGDQVSDRALRNGGSCGRRRNHRTVEKVRCRSDRARDSRAAIERAGVSAFANRADIWDRLSLDGQPLASLCQLSNRPWLPWMVACKTQKLLSPACARQFVTRIWRRN